MLALLSRGVTCTLLSPEVQKNKEVVRSMPSDRWYDVMQVCLNGHKITDTLEHSPEKARGQCPSCGAVTIRRCLACRTSIRGYYHLSGVAGLHGPDVPVLCHACGKPFPWTESRLKAALELAEGVKGLCDAQRRTIKASLDDLVRDTPRTTQAARRFKSIVVKAGNGTAGEFKTILVSVVSEAARKVIWPEQS